MWLSDPKWRLIPLMRFCKWEQFLSEFSSSFGSLCLQTAIWIDGRLCYSIDSSRRRSPGLGCRWPCRPVRRPWTGCAVVREARSCDRAGQRLRDPAENRRILILLHPWEQSETGGPVDWQTSKKTVAIVHSGNYKTVQRCDGHRSRYRTSYGSYSSHLVFACCMIGYLNENHAENLRYSSFDFGSQNFSTIISAIIFAIIALVCCVSGSYLYSAALHRTARRRAAPLGCLPALKLKLNKFYRHYCS